MPRKSRKDRIEEAMRLCYKRLYAFSTPSANFDELIHKNHFWWDYVITEELFEIILEEIMKEYRLRPYEKTGFRQSVLLGLSPTFEKINNGA
jgi:hypothetical protein